MGLGLDQCGLESSLCCNYLCDLGPAISSESVSSSIRIVPVSEVYCEDQMEIMGRVTQCFLDTQ